MKFGVYTLLFYTDHIFWLLQVVPCSEVLKEKPWKLLLISQLIRLNPFQHFTEDKPLKEAEKAQMDVQCTNIRLHD